MSKQQTYELGTAIRITTVLSLASPTSVKITIKDPSSITMTNAVSMTADDPTVYTYIYQSSTADSDGAYLIFIDAVYGSYTSRAVSEFTLIDSDL